MMRIQNPWTPTKWLLPTLLLAFAQTLFAVDPPLVIEQPRERISLNAGWRFHNITSEPYGGPDLSYNSLKPWVLPTGNNFLDAKNHHSVPATHPPSGGFAGETFDDSTWRLLDLPHDFAIEGPFNPKGEAGTGRLPYVGTAWYRKHLNIPAADAGKKIFLDIDGAMSYATVWLNGTLVGGWPYGYASWRVDLTPNIKVSADNLLAIRVENLPDSSRWYPGAGIYRNVWLVKTAPVHIAHWGTYITTPIVTADAATIKIQCTIDDETRKGATVAANTEIFELDAQGNCTGAAIIRAKGAWVNFQPTCTSIQQFQILHPKLWSPATPNRYLAVTTVVLEDGTIADQYETPFGIRTLKFDPNAGFFLNGEHIKLNGVCDHHDLGALGTALNTRALERQLQLLQEMGCNAIRTSHNPPAPELLDLADRMGFLVMDEAFDCWQKGKTDNDYHLLFDDWHEQDLRALIRRDRNHPSVIMWSIGNEVPDQGTPQGPKLAAALSAIVHEEDPTRPTTAACDHPESGFNDFHKNIDIMGFNYKPRLYDRFHTATPAQPYFGSETASTITSRGEYFFPIPASNGAVIHADDGPPGQAAARQLSSYDLFYPPWATSPDQEFAAQDRNPSVAGEFVWTGFDYLGEPTPWDRDIDPSRSSYFGIIDLAGFKKDRFYLYQAKWRSDFPMAHILPHWNWPERVGQITPVHIYTSGDEAELFLNDQSLGRKKKGEFEYRIRWDDVVYQPGELRVTAYKGGKPWAMNVMKTSGPAAQLLLKPDRAAIAADGKDLSFVTLTVADSAGLMVPRSKNIITFGIAGPGEIVATDNGDATDQTPFAAPTRKAFNGLALVIVRAKAGQAGTITLQAKSQGLASAQVTILSK